MRKEIEVKAKIDDLSAIAHNLKKMGVIFSQATKQYDSIFVEDDYGPFEQFQPKKNLLRIRESKGEFTLTLKRPQTNQLDCIEHETRIDNPKATREILNLMGYHEIVNVRKARRTSKYKGLEICLDEVEGLGSFIEIEKITEDTDADTIQNELFSFLKKLGVKPEDRIYDGYDTLIYLKQKASHSKS